MLKRALGTVKETWLYQHKWRFIFGTPLSMYGANWGWEYYKIRSQIDYSVTDARRDSNIWPTQNVAAIDVCIICAETF